MRLPGAHVVATKALLAVRDNIRAAIVTAGDEIVPAYTASTQTRPTPNTRSSHVFGSRTKGSADGASGWLSAGPRST